MSNIKFVPWIKDIAFSLAPQILSIENTARTNRDVIVTVEGFRSLAGIGLLDTVSPKP